MYRMNIYARSVGIAALIALTTTPAFAGREDRAKIAIATARAKIDTANKLGANAESPRLTAEAEASLRAALESLARNKNARAIEQANHATMLAETAVGEAQKNNANREAMLRADTARVEGERRADAENAAATAQEAAAAANARARSAEVAAAAASADAAAARAAPPIVIQQPAPTTTVTTETTKTTPAPAARTVTKTTVKKPAVRKTAPRVAARSSTERTTTTVTTSAN